VPDVIQLLPESISNQIAAGEVVLRPASVVKELLENSVDAGATTIQLIVKDAGRQLVQVVDDGCGMSTTDARLSFERHATSKIRTFEDIQKVLTMGFRGEALASIASVAQVELKTRRLDDELGTHLNIEGSEVKRHEPCQYARGTSLSVRNLFFNTPARRNFLKSNTAEMRHIIEEFQHVALAHPEIAFSMVVNGSDLYRLETGTLRKRIVQMFGKGYDERLVPVEQDGGLMHVSGFIGKPDQARKTRGEQFLFVNKRFIRSNYLNHAVYKAYADLIPENTFPLFVIFIDISPEYTDVNVHPTKQEIKFEDERNVYAYIHASVKHALARFSVTPAIDFEHEEAMRDMGLRPARSKPSPITVSGEAGTVAKPKPLKGQPNWKELYRLARETGEPKVTVPSTSVQPARVEELAPVQLSNAYILSQIKSGFILVDQQAAHERILFERYMSSLEKHPATSQRQLFPRTVHLGMAEAETLRGIISEVNLLGFDVQEFGDTDFVIHALPADVESGDPKDLIEHLLQQFKENTHALNLNRHESLARALATHTALKSGKPLTTQEMRTLVDELFGCSDFQTAPNGRRTFVTFTHDELEKRFSR
jgi:DNA mismatch repair protein MutL